MNSGVRDYPGRDHECIHSLDCIYYCYVLELVLCRVIHLTSDEEGAGMAVICVKKSHWLRSKTGLIFYQMIQRYQYCVFGGELHQKTLSKWTEWDQYHSLALLSYSGELCSLN